LAGSAIGTLCAQANGDCRSKEIAGKVALSGENTVDLRHCDTRKPTTCNANNHADRPAAEFHNRGQTLWAGIHPARTRAADCFCESAPLRGEETHGESP
jgi:hypothetical protein